MFLDVRTIFWPTQWVPEFEIFTHKNPCMLPRALRRGRGFSGGPIWDPPGYPKIFFALRAKSPKNLTLPLKTRKIFFALRARNVPKTTIYPWKPPKFSARFARKKAIDLPLEIRKSSKFSSRFARNIIKNIDLPFKINASFRAKRAENFYSIYP